MPLLVTFTLLWLGIVGLLYMGAKDKDGWAAVIDEMLEEVE